VMLRDRMNRFTLTLDRCHSVTHGSRVRIEPPISSPIKESKARPAGFEPATDRVETGCSIR
jgi:hypothetical protein